MKDYILSNKEAWEEAFDESTQEFKSHTIRNLKTNPKSFFTKELDELIGKDASKEKVIAQFCCNNGRETCALLAYGYQKTVGFDIAENMIAYANQMAKTLNLNAEFNATNILDIDAKFNQTFDTILLTVGAITWFKDPFDLFAVAYRCLKKGGTLIIEDIHPFSNQLATPSEVGFQLDHPKLPIHDYFKSSPWIEEGSMGYMTGKKEGSKTFFSYSHTLSSLLMGLINHGFSISFFSENSVCQANLFDHLNHQGLPLTYLLRAVK